VTFSTNTNCNFSWLSSYYLINTRSLFSKVDELQALLFSNSADIIAITESWLYEDISDDLIALDGYGIYRNERSHARGGSVVCLFVGLIFPANEGWTWRIQASSVCGFGFVPNAYPDPCRVLLFVLFTTPKIVQLKSFVILTSIS
jgi:hypothetical protein